MRNPKRAVRRWGTTAKQVADLVNHDAAARDLVIVSYRGAGSGAVSATTAPLVLGPGENANAKLVAIQARLERYGTDTGPGYVTAGGTLKIATGSFENYCIATNCDGINSGFAALMVKSKLQLVNKPGWHNGLVLDSESIDARAIWGYNYFALEVPGFSVDEGGTVRAHNSVWMGLGTDRPARHLHIRAAATGQDWDVTPEIILEKIVPDSAGEIARLSFQAPGLGFSPIAMVEIVGHVEYVPTDIPVSRLIFKTRNVGGVAARWNMGEGIWSEGVTGGDKGAGAINAAGYWLGGTRVLHADATTPGAVKLGLGGSANDSIAGGAIDYSATNMRVDTEGAEPTDDLVTINGGAPGDVLILRAADPNRTVRVMNGTGNIFCGAMRELENRRSALTLLRTQDDWVFLAYAENG